MIPTALKGFHRCSMSPTYGDWRLREISDNNLFLYLHEIEYLLDRKKMLSFSDIAWKGDNLPLHMTGEKCICCNGKRYIECNTRIPGIVLEDVYNPSFKRYRLLDGKHRIRKMMDKGEMWSYFYVLQLDEIREFFRTKPL